MPGSNVASDGARATRPNNLAETGHEMSTLDAKVLGMTNSTDFPTDLTPALAADDPRSVIAGAVALAGDTIAAVQPDQLDLPTPCDEFTARELIGHLLTVLQRVAVLGEGGDPMAMPSVTVVPDAEIVDAWTAAAHRVQAAWTDDALLDRTMVLPWATAPGRAMLGTYTNELSVHTWDLATAVGASPAWDDRVIAVAFESIQRALPGEGRTERFAAAVANMPAGMAMPTPPFAERVDVAADAPLIDRLVAWTGRRP